MKVQRGSSILDYIANKNPQRITFGVFLVAVPMIHESMLFSLVYMVIFTLESSFYIQYTFSTTFCLISYFYCAFKHR